MEPLGGVVKVDCWAPPPEFLIQSEGKVKICISNEFLGDANKSTEMRISASEPKANWGLLSTVSLPTGSAILHCPCAAGLSLMARSLQKSLVGSTFSYHSSNGTSGLWSDPRLS